MNGAELILKDLIQSLQDQMLHPHPTTSPFKSVYEQLLNHLEQLALQQHPEFLEKLKELKHLAAQLYSKEPKRINDYHALDFLLFTIDSLYQQSCKLLETLQRPYWKPKIVERSLELILNGMNLLAAELKKVRPEKSDAQCRIAVVSVLLPPELYNHPVVVEFFFRKEGFAIVEALNPQECKRRLQIILQELSHPEHFVGDEENYASFYHMLIGLNVTIEKSQKNDLHRALHKFLKITPLSLALFLTLLSLLPADIQKELLQHKGREWAHDFLHGLECGDIDAVQHCLWMLSVAEYRRFLIPQIAPMPSLQPYLEALDVLPPQHYVTQGLHAVLTLNRQSRPMQASIDWTEFGLALSSLRLLELGVNHQGIIALEARDLSALQRCQDNFWQPMDHGFSLVGLATRLTLLSQARVQEVLDLSSDPGKQRAAEEFFFSFLEIVKERWSKTRDWTTVMQIMEQIASNNNVLLANMDGKHCIGRWDDPTAIYDRVLKLFLPEEEQHLWQNYCRDMSQDPKWMQKARRLAYSGSQEFYGHWFHLNAKAALEAMQQGNDWPRILQHLGLQRYMAALMMSNMRFQRHAILSLANQIVLSKIDRDFPGSPLDFGRLMRPWETSCTTLAGAGRSYYVDKMLHLIQDFHTEFKEAHILSSHGHAYQFKGREVVVYPAEQKATYVIASPVKIEGKPVKATHILWNWPPNIPFFPEEGLPTAFTQSHLGMFIHANGEDKDILDREVQRLFNKLTSQVLEEMDLARFFYLYFQNLPFKRGSAAIGMILLNLILMLHGRKTPTAPPQYRALDCESMCATEAEFSQGFITWLHGGPFF